MPLTPERERELATRVAQDIVSESGAEYLPYIDWHAVIMRLPDVPELGGLSRHDQVDPGRRIAALARTAIVTVELPKPPPVYDVIVWLMEDNHWFGEDGWTWCKVIDGDPDDYTGNLPRCADEADARTKAQAWLDSVRAPQEGNDDA